MNRHISPSAENALRVLKRPLPVTATFAPASGVCQTLEGPVHYQAGDALLTGIRGETWPVSRAAFTATYAPAPDAPDHYIKLPQEARALRLSEPMQIPVGWQNDPLCAEAGDWLLFYADGSQGVVRDDIFRQTYGPAPGETRWPT